MLGTGRYNYVCPTHLRSSSYVLLRLHECALAFSFSGGMRLSLPDPREQDTLPAALFLSQLARWTYSMHLESDTLHGGNRRLFERSACVMLRCGIVQPSARSVLRGCPPESRKRQSDRAKPSRALAGCKTMGCGESVVWHERVCSVCPSATAGCCFPLVYLSEDEGASTARARASVQGGWQAPVGTLLLLYSCRAQVSVFFRQTGSVAVGGRVSFCAHNAPLVDEGKSSDHVVHCNVKLAVGYCDHISHAILELRVRKVARTDVRYLMQGKRSGLEGVSDITTPHIGPWRGELSVALSTGLDWSSFAS